MALLCCKILMSSFLHALNLINHNALITLVVSEHDLDLTCPK